jgi:hypothetical protein
MTADARSFDPGEPRQRRFTAYGKAPFPDPRDEELDQFVDEVERGGPPAVKATSERASEQGRGVLGAYAGRAATRAVREKDPKRLLQALVALVLSGLGHNSRDALTRMPLIEDAAGRLGVQLPHLIEDAADVVGHPGSVSLVSWLARQPEDRTLESMGYEAGSDESGFRYQYTA